MGILLKLLTAGAIGVGVNKIGKKIAEENRRKHTPCTFDDRISQLEFNVIVKRAIRSINRIESFFIDGAVVSATVRSQSGLSDWSFTVDFNDYGQITGTYWLSSENDDSNIPQILADRISAAIVSFPKWADSSFEDEVDAEDDLDYQLEAAHAFCPYCEKKVTVVGAQFCSYCGKRLHI